jgi:hypothetical protein
MVLKFRIIGVLLRFFHAVLIDSTGELEATEKKSFVVYNTIRYRKKNRVSIPKTGIGEDLVWWPGDWISL